MSCPSAEIIILDGGFSTQVEKNLTSKDGKNFNKDPLWTARLLEDDPAAVIKTHLDFLRAGSEFISTATYQASINGFIKHLKLSEKEARELIRKAFTLANEAVNLYKKECPDKEPVIVGSIGPYGAVLNDGSEYTGNYADAISKEELKNWHRPRIEELSKCGIKHFAFETIPNQKEAEVLTELLIEFPGIKAWLSFTCKNDQTLPHGENFQEVALKCYNQNPQQILAIGLNCLNPSLVETLLKNLNSTQTIPLIVYPNRAETYSIDEGRWIKSEEYLPIENFVENWLNLGVRYIGGCCRTGAEDITQIKNAVLAWQEKNL